MIFASGNSYIETNFESLLFEKKEFGNIEFEKCIFNKCTFIDCKFTNCTFDNCVFNSSTISAVKFIDCTIRKINCFKSHMVGIDWSLMNVPFSTGLNFEECDISYSNFRHLDMKGCLIKSCVANEADFIETNLQKAQLTGTNFAKSTFLNTDLTEADLTKSINYYIDPRTNKIKKAKFSTPEVLNLLKGFNIRIDEE